MISSPNHFSAATALYIYNDIMFYYSILRYYETLRTAFLSKIANDCFLFRQENCVYAKITALICLKIDSGHVKNNLQQFKAKAISFQRFGNKME